VRLRLSIACLAFVASAAVLSYDRLAESPGDRMTAATEQLLASLDEGQRSKAKLGYDSPERPKWNFVPLETRKGLPLKEMTEEQRGLARSLMSTALSEAGREKAESIVHLERLLRALEGEGRKWPRDWLLYYVAVYGDPAAGGRWGSMRRDRAS
jgi:hypothetical protein